jgi:predicted nucleotidyltransferase
MDESLIEALRSALAADSTLRLAYIFGSVGRGEQGPASDVDVAILADHELGLARRAELAEVLARASSVGRRFDVVDLRTASPTLRAEVVRDGVVLIERDRLTRFDFEMDAIRRFEDTRPLRRVQHQLLREATRGPA